jgi:hypothetical protein
MTLEHLRTLGVALIAAAGLAASCSRHSRPPEEPAIAGRQLGESTASPGDDPTRPLAQSVDTQDVSVRISSGLAGRAKAQAPASPGEPPRAQPPARSSRTRPPVN